MKSLDSIEKSLEDRFDKKNQTINESHIRDYDLQKQNKQASTFFRIEFSSSIPEETKSFLRDNTPTILDFPSKFSLKILHKNHLIQNLGSIFRVLTHHIPRADMEHHRETNYELTYL